MVAQDGNFDLVPIHELFNQHLLIVAQRLFDRGWQLAGIVRFADAHTRSQIGRLDEARKPETRGHLDAAFTVFAPLPAPKRHPVGDRDLVIAQHLFHLDLVHAQCRAEHTGTDVGHIGQIKEALHGAVFAIGSVQNRENHVQRLLHGAAE